MNLRIVEPATGEPVTLDEARLQCRVDPDPLSSPPMHADDSLIERLIVTAREHAELYTSRALTDAVYEARYDGFAHACAWRWGSPYAFFNAGYLGNYFAGPRSRALFLPIAPVDSVESITYVDINGATIEWPTDQWVFDDDLDQPAIRLEYGAYWPSTRAQANAVRVRFRSGYQRATDSPLVNPFPSSIKSAMLLMIADWYENREDSQTVAAITQLPRGAEALLRPYRINSGTS